MDTRQFRDVWTAEVILSPPEKLLQLGEKKLSLRLHVETVKMQMQLTLLLCFKELKQMSSEKLKIIFKECQFLFLSFFSKHSPHNHAGCGEEHKVGASLPGGLIVSTLRARLLICSVFRSLLPLRGHLGST